MSSAELMPIGTFARRSGLTASALRFYADSGLLTPAKVDPVSGYRFYDSSQLERAVLLGRVREIGMPLSTVESVLDGTTDEAVRLVEEHARKVAGDAAAAQRRAAAIAASLTGEPESAVTTLSGPVFAAAIEQVLSATARESGLAVLNGVRFESAPEALIVTATDRYRLATRTLVPAEPVATTWAVTVDADDLRFGLPGFRRSPRVDIAATQRGFRVRTDGRGDQLCRVLAEPFPDYRLMLDGLPEVITRVTAEKASVLRAVEAASSDRILLTIRGGALTVSGTSDEPDGGVRVPANVTGPDLDICFELTTLHPAVSTAIGADLLLDLRGAEQPVTIRSADHGDFTTVAMPTRLAREAEPRSGGRR